jgi:hypothetical protein
MDATDEFFISWISVDMGRTISVFGIKIWLNTLTPSRKQYNLGKFVSTCINQGKCVTIYRFNEC